MIGDCASLFYYVCFLWGNLDLMTQSLSFEDPRLSLVFFKSFLKIDFFYFHHSTLSYWALNFMISYVFFFTGLSIFHISSHGLVELTGVD